MARGPTVQCGPHSSDARRCDGRGSEPRPGRVDDPRDTDGYCGDASTLAKDDNDMQTEAGIAVGGSQSAPAYINVGMPTKHDGAEWGIPYSSPLGTERTQTHGQHTELHQPMATEGTS